LGNGEERLTVRVLSPQNHAVSAHEPETLTRKRQAAFIFAVVRFPHLKGRHEKFRIHNHASPWCVIIVVEIVNNDTLADANLRRGEPDTRGGVYRIEHVANEGPKVLVEGRDRSSRGVEHRLAADYDGTNCHSFSVIGF
jgi:hypothetical protein